MINIIDTNIYGIMQKTLYANYPAHIYDFMHYWYREHHIKTSKYFFLNNL